MDCVALMCEIEMAWKIEDVGWGCRLCDGGDEEASRRSQAALGVGRGAVHGSARHNHRKWSTCKLAGALPLRLLPCAALPPAAKPPGPWVFNARTSSPDKAGCGKNHERTGQLTLIRRFRHVKQPVLVRLLTSLALCRVGATIRLGSVVEGRGIRPGIGW